MTHNGRFLNQALLRANYNKARTAEEIGLSRQGLFKLIKKHKIEAPSRDFGGEGGARSAGGPG